MTLTSQRRRRSRRHSVRCSGIWRGMPPSMSSHPTPSKQSRSGRRDEPPRRPAAHQGTVAVAPSRQRRSHPPASTASLTPVPIGGTGPPGVRTRACPPGHVPAPASRTNQLPEPQLSSTATSPPSEAASKSSSLQRRTLPLQGRSSTGVEGRATPPSRSCPLDCPLTVVFRVSPPRADSPTVTSPRS